MLIYIVLALLAALVMFLSWATYILETELNNLDEMEGAWDAEN